MGDLQISVSETISVADDEHVHKCNAHKTGEQPPLAHDVAPVYLRGGRAAMIEKWGARFSDSTLDRAIDDTRDTGLIPPARTGRPKRTAG